MKQIEKLLKLVIAKTYFILKVSMKEDVLRFTNAHNEKFLVINIYNKACPSLSRPSLAFRIRDTTQRGHKPSQN